MLTPLLTTIAHLCSTATVSHCCAHAGQLVLKDGIKLDEEYTKLIKKVSKDIVSKTKVSNLIAEEVRKLEKTLLTYVITRWNSILFMIRSVLRLTDDDFKQIRKSMPKRTTAQREAKEKFKLSKKERAMIGELAEVLKHFEWLTDNLQTNEVSISRVYPCIVSLRVKILENLDQKSYTKQLRRDLVESLDKRFELLIENDLFILSTFLDPFFGPKSFPLEKRNQVKLRLKYHLGLLRPNSNQSGNSETLTAEEKTRCTSNFIFHDVESTTITSLDDLDILIKQYVDHVATKTYEDPLLFWKWKKNWN